MRRTATVQVVHTIVNAGGLAVTVTQDLGNYVAMCWADPSTAAVPVDPVPAGGLAGDRQRAIVVTRTP